MNCLDESNPLTRPGHEDTPPPLTCEEQALLFALEAFLASVKPIVRGAEIVASGDAAKILGVDPAKLRK